MNNLLSVQILASLLVAWSPSNSRATELPDLIDIVRPSVLLVGTYALTDSPRFTFRGTGFVVGNGNLAITNAHVLPTARINGDLHDLMVQSFDATEGLWRPRLARIVAADTAHDLVLLRFEGRVLVPLSISEIAPREGVSVALMGFPLAGALGYSMVTHRGVVSAKTSIAVPANDVRQLDERRLRQLRVGNFDVLQLDAVAYPGNSGGPVFDLTTGSVIGVVSMVMVKGTKESVLSSPTGISYAVPAVYVNKLLLEFAKTP